MLSEQVASIATQQSIQARIFFFFRESYQDATLLELGATLIIQNSGSACFAYIDTFFPWFFSLNCVFLLALHHQ